MARRTAGPPQRDSDRDGHRRNGRGVNVMSMTAEVGKRLSAIELPEGVVLSYGGELEENNDTMPDCTAALCYRHRANLPDSADPFQTYLRSRIPAFEPCVMPLRRLVGRAGAGVSFRCHLHHGTRGLMGIIVRNGIIMLDYALNCRPKACPSCSRSISRPSGACVRFSSPRRPLRWVSSR